MIITRLMGGLGNQMFQYAAGKSLSLLHGTELLLDVSHLGKKAHVEDTKRDFELDKLVANVKVSTEKDFEPFLKLGSSKTYRSFQRIFPSLFNKTYFAETGQRFHASFFNLPANVYLNGFWQSEKYFLKYADEIRKTFQRFELLSEPGKKILSEIKNTNSIGIHVRRGDYISNAKANSFHGVCSVDYYKSAVLKINEKANSKPDLFVFSDDIEWCKNNFQFENKITFVENYPDKKSFEDLLLMSICSHNIIANSSYSWWGAWLNSNKSKIVIAPVKWFNQSELDTIDLFPASWIQL